MLIEARMQALAIDLPNPSIPGANYLPFVGVSDVIHLTGQLSQWNGERKFIGKLGEEFDIQEGVGAARLCALNLVAQLRVALAGDLDRVIQCIRVCGYVNSAPDFTGHSQVIDGASNLFVDIFGDAGRHTRIAVGVASLPYGVAVEVEAQFRVRATS